MVERTQSEEEMWNIEERSWFYNCLLCLLGKRGRLFKFLQLLFKHVIVPVFKFFFQKLIHVLLADLGVEDARSESFRVKFLCKLYGLIGFLNALFQLWILRWRLVWFSLKLVWLLWCNPLSFDLLNSGLEILAHCSQINQCFSENKDPWQEISNVELRLNLNWFWGFPDRKPSLIDLKLTFHFKFNFQWKVTCTFLN